MNTLNPNSQHLLDLVVANMSELTGDIKIGGSQGYSDCALVEFAVRLTWWLVTGKKETLHPVLTRE